MNEHGSADAARTPVSVIGLGAMGSALAGAFLARGHATTVWNRSAARADSLVAKGATRAATVADAVAASELVVVCVLDYAAAREQLEPVAETLAGRVLVNLCSGSPEQAREMAEWAAGHGAEYLDGAIMTTPPGVGGQDMMFLYGGSAAAFAAHRDTLAALGDPINLGTDPGLACLYDTALLGLMWSTLTGWLHGVAVAGADGVAATAYTPIALRWMTAIAGFMTTYAPQVDQGSYPGDDASLDVHVAAIQHLVHASEARGVDRSLPELLLSMIERAAADGHNQDSYARLIDVLRPAASA
ncbi:NAD(P)-dependent oxidoreductase [Goodfellowiella coeruleoviolacea]|uniref:3-hydroxyisobutyrate dehydrogenase n=1 Tax=Goodfellowiella coeruleoviolacea TaxID=334858 RepID=A0AAE3KGW2_9PSEU|nr:NAD(P)-binding domain-containing protein [Goodfellowiella coeruleoviolacea]MCP2166282.1 3-hydroxyisobutyrate dehydrogenase [Goodfellowiella coeruleoviolacea]